MVLVPLGRKSAVILPPKPTARVMGAGIRGNRQRTLTTYCPRTHALVVRSAMPCPIRLRLQTREPQSKPLPFKTRTRRSCVHFFARRILLSFLLASQGRSNEPPNFASTAMHYEHDLIGARVLCCVPGARLRLANRPNCLSVCVAQPANGSARDFDVAITLASRLCQRLPKPPISR